jgi:hypothetical protein
MMDPIKNKKAVKKTGVIPGYDEIKNRFKGRYKVSPIRNKANQYTLTDKSGNTVTYTPGPKVKDKSASAKSILRKRFNQK